MTHLSQLDPPIPLWTTKGEGLAHFVIDYGVHEHHVVWGVCLYEGGAWWWLENPEVRGMANQTIGREKDKAETEWDPILTPHLRPLVETYGPLGSHPPSALNRACTCGVQAFCDRGCLG